MSQPFLLYRFIATIHYPQHPSWPPTLWNTFDQATCIVNIFVHIFVFIHTYVTKSYVLSSIADCFKLTHHLSLLHLSCCLKKVGLQRSSLSIIYVSWFPPSLHSTWHIYWVIFLGKQREKRGNGNLWYHSAHHKLIINVCFEPYPIVIYKAFFLLCSATVKNKITLWVSRLTQDSRHGWWMAVGFHKVLSVEPFKVNLIFFSSSNGTRSLIHTVWEGWVSSLCFSAVSLLAIRKATEIVFIF